MDFNVRRDETGLSSSPDAELKTYVDFFEKNAYRLRYRDVSGSLSENEHHTLMKIEWFVTPKRQKKSVFAGLAPFSTKWFGHRGF